MARPIGNHTSTSGYDSHLHGSTYYSCYRQPQGKQAEKGGGYHLDLLMVAITIGINSVLGLPWMVAATVLSINHVLSLKKETESSAPGEKPRFLGVIEQRVTNTLVFVLIGCSIFLSNLLRVSSIFVFINS